MAVALLMVSASIAGALTWIEAAIGKTTITHTTQTKQNPNKHLQ